VLHTKGQQLGGGLDKVLAGDFAVLVDVQGLEQPGVGPEGCCQGQDEGDRDHAAQHDDEGREAGS
jgi:hypothetical protein